MAIHAPPALEKERLHQLLNVNLDARRYFFHKADERWLDWLWRNGFLDAIKDENANPLATRTPELDYLLRMAGKRPDIVVDIMLATPITTDTRSQEVAYGFIRVCGSLPADQLARMVDKSGDERWMPLIVAIYHRTAIDSKEMIKTLADANDFRVSWRSLRQCWLCAQAKNLQMGVSLKTIHSTWRYLARAGIFEQLASVQAKYAEGALALAIRILSEYSLSPINMGYLKWISSPCTWSGRFVGFRSA